jgi:ribonuclease P/MRP protein subunit RPP40
MRAIDTGLPVDAIFVDFSKAFDRVDHERLLNSLVDYAFPPMLVIWLTDFLRRRSFRVRVNGVLSSSYEVKSGVPQGTVLGPILFNIYINKVPLSTMSECILFADDLKIWRVIERPEDIILLQSDLDNLQRISRELRLPLNHAKCYHLPVGRSAGERQYTISDKIIAQQKVVKDLGTWIRSTHNGPYGTLHGKGLSYALGFTTNLFLMESPVCAAALRNFCPTYPRICHSCLFSND